MINGGDDVQRGPSGITRRAGGRGFLLGAAAVSIMMLVGGLVISSLIRSPAQIAAETAPPAFSVVTAPVIGTRLESAVTAEATVRPARRVRLASMDAALTDGRSVLTKLTLRKGEKVRAGTVLFEVSTMPVFAFPGATPSFRNLQLGVSGPDVKQLQKALQLLGYSTGNDEKGTFDRGTSGAVRQFYEAKGYAPVRAPAVESAAGGRDEGGKKKKAPDAGYMMPMSAVVFLRDLPARVDAVLGAVGDLAGGDVLDLSSGRLVVSAIVDEQVIGKITPGNKAELFLPGSDTPRQGRVASVKAAAAGAGAADSDSDGAAVSYTVDLKVKGDLPADLVGASLRVRIVQDAMTTPGLVVPIAALSSDASGAAFVTVVLGDGAQHAIPVQVGFVADGQVEVIPAAGALKAGDAVRLGISAVGANGSDGSNDSDAGGASSG